MSLINLIKTETGYDTATKNGVVKGQVYKLEDGFYYYEMIGKGVWSSFALREMATILDDLNAEWKRGIDEGQQQRIKTIS